MPTITKEVTCPLCDEVFDADIDPADTDQEIDCPECNETLGVEYDPATQETTLVELLEDEEDETAEGAIVDPPDDEPDAE